MWPAVQEGDLADVVLPEQLHQQAGQPETEAAVGRGAEAEEVEVVLDRPGLDVLVLGLCDELLMAVLALGLSIYLRPLIGYKAWRVLHYGTYLSFPAVLLHGIFTGTDTSSRGGSLATAA